MVLFQVSFYLCRVVFEGEPPKHIEYVAATYDGDVRSNEVVTPVNMDCNVAQISMQDVSGFIGPMRWS